MRSRAHLRIRCASRPPREVWLLTRWDADGAEHTSVWHSEAAGLHALAEYVRGRWAAPDGPLAPETIPATDEAAIDAYFNAPDERGNGDEDFALWAEVVRN